MAAAASALKLAGTSSTTSGLNDPPVLRIFHARFGAGEKPAGGHALKLTRKERRRRAAELASGLAASRESSKRCPHELANQQIYLCVSPREGAVVVIGRSGGRGPGVKIKGKALDRKGAEARTVATRDPADRAHDIRDQDNFLVSATGLDDRHARARRYPRSQMTSRGVAFDSAFDAWHERRLRLGGVSGLGVRERAGGSSGLTGMDMVERAGYEAARRGTTLRAVMERNVEGVEGRLESAEAVLARYRRGEWKAEE